MYLAIPHAGDDFPTWKNSLQKIGQKYPIDSFERVVMTGDYFGKAEHAEETARMLLALDKNKNYDHFLFLRGTMEHALLCCADEDEEVSSPFMEWLIEDGKGPLLEVLKSKPDLFEALLKLIGEMPLFYEEAGYLFTHRGINLDLWRAGLDKKTTLEMLENLKDKDPIKLLWNYSFFRELQKDEEKLKLKSFPFTLIAGGWDGKNSLPYPVQGPLNGHPCILTDMSTQVKEVKVI